MPGSRDSGYFNTSHRAQEALADMLSDGRPQRVDAFARTNHLQREFNKSAKRLIRKNDPEAAKLFESTAKTKITKQKLVAIIKEELSAVMNEGLGSAESRYAEMKRPENVRAYFQDALNDPTGAGWDSARDIAQTSPYTTYDIEDALYGATGGLGNFMDEVLKHMQDPRSDREYMFGEPDRGAGDRGRYNGGRY